METNRVVHNVLVSCALVSVTVLSIATSVFLIKWAMPAKHVEEIAQNLAQHRTEGESPDQGPADVIGAVRDLRIAAGNLRNITDQLVQQRRSDDPNLENIAPIVRFVNNADRIVDHLQRDRNPDTLEDDPIPVVNIINGANRIVDHLKRDRDPDETEGDPIPVVNIVNGANRIVDHLQRDRDPDETEDDPIPVVRVVNNIQDISQAVASPVSGTRSGLARGARWVGRGVGGMWNYFFGGNGNCDEPTDDEEQEEILILEPDPNWNGEENSED